MKNGLMWPFSGRPLRRGVISGAFCFVARARGSSRFAQPNVLESEMGQFPEVVCKNGPGDLAMPVIESFAARNIIYEILDNGDTPLRLSATALETHETRIGHAPLKFVRIFGADAVANVFLCQQLAVGFAVKPAIRNHSA